jgi:hypothetical protein
MGKLSRVPNLQFGIYLENLSDFSWVISASISKRWFGNIQSAERFRCKAIF